MNSQPRPNPLVENLRCIRCGTDFPLDDYHGGCPRCHADGHAASLYPVYAALPADLGKAGVKGCERYAGWLVYDQWLSLGEGGTPLIALDGLAGELGLDALLVKYEGANPTGSHKDRMSMLGVARAADIGASVVAAASSGNAGVSVAAYAARAGLDCIILTTPGIDPTWRRAIEMHGAKLIAAADSLARWRYLKQGVERDGWYPLTNYLIPAVGSNPFGVDGYRSLAFELEEQLGVGKIDHILVPAARGDLLWGVAKGLKGLQEAGLASRLPRVHAVEPFPRLTKVIEGADYRDQFPGTTEMVSIGGTTVTFQAIDALKMCGGTAVAVREADVAADRMSLARAGLYLELSAAAALTGLRELRSRAVVLEGDMVVLIGTSHGFKEQADFSVPVPVV